ncbi:1,4-dihydroxy-2-naphthoate polyprenyltransferase [Dermatophilus congolensis]|uniref:1,4-dihydroxy-2-naphthoate octaprenyltransferase n=1 Tax=Dermatophilus congolensis TaxID=1863 RepID=A0A239VAZ4_9MICO|nr:1,4-dihydroxy-2-naphthoate polyprenyltransferase [Dermatophilus congolensis]MBO3128465.1 1,4-dihydroxy-2-naphthoate polyprenyltransferase [Dermatophilus congolensis]MBO3132896.1 1,4-dihydroxy-2-naphthoate polyprenyltransferase [Dermatophilus congolensis]MBO3132945.1 1,4-dihydroxy-2-naphthoate polyprenyltransferase [Dermatophilus congolensis]MBO3135182.1 1,4-dihydroxy-2-naphthoate polyprenyltransferase [Dermatophilus congolensis]MBO3137420.1 1,4-dihydroxy-2-naphthoate polyprenyltransferase [
MATYKEWVQGARPRTLPAAVAPVVIGAGSAYAVDRGIFPFAVLALLVALALQVGVNYANDYSDGIRGTDDTNVRIGPVRLVGQGLATPQAVKNAAFISFGVAAFFGLALVAFANTLWMIGVGLLAIIAAWFYTGGKKPYGYLGLGEVMVFIFFGLVATLGTTYTQTLYITPASIAGAVGVGSLSCAILMVNNLRDIHTDPGAGKITLAVRLGEPGARLAYAGMIAIAAICSLVAGFFHPGAWFCLITFVYIIPGVRQVLRGSSGRDLITVLGRTGKFTLIYGIFLGLGMAIWRLPAIG